MRDERPQPLFLAGEPGLDFLNSIATPVDTRVDWLASGSDLLAWLEAAGLIADTAAAELRRSALPGEFDAVAAQARALREWFRSFVHAHKGKPLRPNAVAELEPLNRLLARDETFGQIVARESGDRTAPSLRWVLERRWRSPESLLLPIARALAGVICDVDFTDVKACEGASCTLVYVDRTPRRSRRWCSMAVCGNRWKQAVHRSRTKKRA